MGFPLWDVARRRKSVVAFSWATRARRRHVAIAGQELLTLQKLQPSISAAAIAGEVRNSHEMVRWTSGARFYFPATIFTLSNRRQTSSFRYLSILRQPHPKTFYLGDTSALVQPTTGSVRWQGPWRGHCH